MADELTGPGGRGIALIAAAVALGIGLLALTTPSTASASHQPICDEYPDLPQCDHGKPPPPPPPPGFCEKHPDNPRCTDEVGPSAGGGGPSAGGGGGDASKGSLPFTGYPLSPLLLLLLLLLIGGLSIRAYLAARDRLRGARGAGGT